MSRNADDPTERLPKSGRRLGPYEIEREIGRGGMGQVFRATQPSLGRSVAVKVLPEHLAGDEEFVKRFVREAKATAALSHPGIVTIFDVGESDGTYYFAMELLEGETLDALIRRRGMLEVEEAIGIARSLTVALGHAHERGILHRDVKPANIFLEASGRTVLTDFGIAWAATDTRLTQTGTRVGSPKYMAPEIFKGYPSDERSDLYAIGVLLFSSLTGRAPFSGDSHYSIGFKHVNEEVPSVRERNPKVPEPVEAIVNRLLAKEPDDRYSSCDELLKALDESGVLRHRGAPRPKREAAAPTVVMEEANAVPQRQSPSQRRRARPSEPAPVPERKSKVPVIAVAIVVALAGLAYLSWDQLMPATQADGGSVAESNQPAESTESTVADGEADESRGESRTPPAGATDSRTGGIQDPARSEESAPNAGPREADDPITGASPPDPIDEASAAEPQAVRSAVVPPPVAVETFQITSRPAGATVTLDDRELPSTTPVEVALSTDEFYGLTVSLDDHEPASFGFRLDDLTESQRRDRTLHFPLTPSTPPGVLVNDGTFPARLTIGSRTYEIDPGEELSLQPGRLEVQIDAPHVYYSDVRTLQLESEGRVPLRLPAVTTITIGATPGFCRVSLDGEDLGYVPATVELVVGAHDFVFTWENLDKTLETTRTIVPDTGRVFVAAPEDGS